MYLRWIFSNDPTQR